MGGIQIWAVADEGPGKRTPKQLGEIAEAEFIAKAVGLGFVVAKPWGDSEPYDFIVKAKKSFHFWRVQVKSAHTIGADGGCSFRAHDHAQRSYTFGEYRCTGGLCASDECLVCDAGAGGGGVEIVDAVSGESGTAVAV